MIRKIQNLLIFFYFPFFFVSVEIAKRFNIESLIVLSNLPLLFYLLLNIKKLKQRLSPFKKDFLFFFIILYLFLQVYSTFNIDSVYLASANTITLLSVFFFSFSFYNDSANEFEEKIIYLTLSIIFAFILVILPLLYFGNFTIGHHYQLLFDANKTGGMKIPFLKTTLDAPNLSSITFLITLFILLNKKKIHFFNANYLIVVIIFILSLAEILLINRRGPMFGTFLTVFFIFSPKIFVFILPFLIFIPFYWDSVLKFLLPVIYNSPLSNIIVNKDYTNLVEAGFRSYVWEVAGGLFTKPSFSFSYLFGYGYLPEFQKLGGYGHAHNGFLELFLLSGFSSLLILIFISGVTIIRSYYILRSKEFNISKLLTLIFFFLLYISSSESIFFNNFFSNNLYLILLILINISYYHYFKVKNI
jgi:hypothetical protein